MQPNPQQTQHSLIGELLESLEAGTSILDIASSLLGQEHLTHLLESHHIKIPAFVLDTNVIVPDLKWYYGNRHLTGIMKLSRMGVRLYASTTVWDEVMESFVPGSRKAKKMFRDFSEDQLAEVQQLWEHQYSREIAFLDPSDVRLDSARTLRLAERDNGDDLPTGILVELIRPSLLLSADKHLDEFGRLRQEDISDLVQAYCTVKYRDTFFIGLNLGGVIVFVSASSLLQLLFEWLGYLSALGKRIPPWFWVLLLAVTGIAVAVPSSRRWLGQQVHGLRSTVAQIAPPVWQAVKTLVDAIGVYEQESAEARTFIEAHQHPDEEYLDTDLGFIYSVLSTSTHGLTPTELVSRMLSRGYIARSSHPEIAVGRVLHQYPSLFEESPRRYWHLKGAEPSGASES